MVRKALAALGLVLVLTPSIASRSTKPGSLHQISSHSFLLSPSQWYLQYSAGVPVHPAAEQDGWSFDFPVYDEPSTNCAKDKSCGHVNCITTPVNAAITAATVTMTFRIETTGAPIFQYGLNPNNNCTNPAAVRLFIQRQGDTLEADHEFYEQGRRRAHTGMVNPYRAPDPGAVAIRVRKNWRPRSSCVCGVSRRSSVCRQHRDDVRWGCFAGHGVNISGGTARFSLTRYRLI